MTRVAFLGLGQMGMPMARRLLGPGTELVVWNRSRERATALVDEGARVATTPAEAARHADVTITMLSTPEAVNEVLFGTDGVSEALVHGSTLIEMSTIGPDAVRRIRQRIDDRVTVVDAPVLGSVPQATEGTLRIFVGADDDVVERLRPVLEPMGTVIHMGALGAGASMKLVANSTIGAAISALGEALALADALGLRREDVLEILSKSPVGPTASAKRDHILTGSYPARFKLSLAAKDLRLVTEEAARAGLELGVARVAREWLERAERDGRGDEDYSAVVETITQRR